MIAVVLRKLTSVCRTIVMKVLETIKRFKVATDSGYAIKLIMFFNCFMHILRIARETRDTLSDLLFLDILLSDETANAITLLNERYIPFFPLLE
jgi:hypothetical protein